ncbi:hybrid sensor histidine kinase/response regulator [Corallococcus praedator]|uniref:histidine kinase n=1 Tax=Corallococcus praedator TaxID=2316724 RepID=A0ABX9QFF3_9BACT|nr:MULTISPECIES: response regulator [Corallococcus]RKH19177.1 hybrid sensor histidine kinase/response regulator [Corallococcus sp. CA047B]RKH27514.1 hybrid sensor histidine kinase/response regulator [Corallococcus sp. CA031C]RKI02696.1 hybrid sensor histidine kinase/response regulator [Corallococcus praedator]
MNPSERLLKQFRDLVTVRLERINRSLMELEAGGSLEAGQRVLRELHGLKGEARMMGFDEINTLVHQMEELVRCAEPHRYRLSSESTDALLTTADTVLALSGALQAAEPPLAVETLVATLQQRTTAEAARPVVPRTLEEGGWAAPPKAPGATAKGEGAASQLLATTRAESGAPVVPAHWSTMALRPESAPGAGMSPVTAASHLLMTAIRSEPPGGQTALGASQGTPGGVHPGSSASGAPGGAHTATVSAAGWHPSGLVPGAPVGAHLASSPTGGSVGSHLAGAASASSGSHLVSPATGAASTGAHLLNSTAGGPAGSPFVNPASAPLPGTRLIDSASRSRPPSGVAPKAGGGAVRNGDVRVDTAVRIGVASLDMLTSAVTNLGQVARRRELANARRLALVRELSELARAAEDLGPAGVAIAERLGRAKELAATLHREAKLLANAELRDLGQVSEEVQTLRMLPLAVLFEPYPRMVRDLARELGKEVELVVDGEDTRADRSVVEALREPLMHLVRNALDHGLETRVDRVAAGKHPRGCLTLRAAREGSRIVLRVEDDGMGMDPALLRRVAVRRGVLDEATANALSDAAARDLIFLPGFSSREVVTDLSGRGVGLDAVRASLQALGGDVGVESAPGWGTIFTLRVPVSLTVAPLLFVQVGDETLALGAVHVSRALKVEAAEVGEVAGRPVLRAEGRVLPFASLASLLGHAAERPAREGELVLVVKGQGMEAALAVDRVLEERVQAILPLKGILARFTHLTGATSLADGRLAMVLSAATLAAGVHGTAPLRLVRPPVRAQEVRRRRILVVDDSPLTRELVANLLEAVGYDTLRAPDGVGALALLGEDGPPVELVVTDLEMPEMDGVELTRRLKTDPARSGLPVVILTTRGGEVDRARGLAAGADGYITKGDLVRQDLVDVVGRLLA